jgi:DegV family protein with EDD domain
MEKFAIISDNACDLDKALRDRFGVDDLIIGTVTFPDGHTEKSDVDWVKHDPDEYFKSMSDKKHIYKSAAANVAEITEAFEKQVKAGRPVLAIVLSSALSGTYNFCLKAAEAVKAKFPAAKIKVIDSQRYSTSLGSLVVYACQLREQGKSFEEVATWVEANKNCFHQMGVMDDLFFLSRTGRISKAKAFMGNLVGVKPMADFNGHGLSEVIAKVKGLKNAFQVTIDYMKKTIVDPDNQIVFIAQSYRKEPVKVLEEMVRDQIHPKEIIVTPVDMSSGANIGPGLMACFYYGKQISNDLVDEKAIMAELTGK